MFCCILGCLLFLICIELVYLYFPVLFSLSVSIKWLAVKIASEMTYTVSSGALNSTPTNHLMCIASSLSLSYFLYCQPQSNYSTSVVLFTCLRFYLNVHMIHRFFSLLKTRLFHKLFLSAQGCFCQDFLQSLASCTVIFSYFSIVISYLMLCQVSYDVDGFCERNRDVLFTDLIQLMQSSTQWVLGCSFD